MDGDGTPPAAGTAVDASLPQLLPECENHTDSLWVKLSAIHHGLRI